MKIYKHTHTHTPVNTSASSAFRLNQVVCVSTQHTDEWDRLADLGLEILIRNFLVFCICWLSVCGLESSERSTGTTGEMLGWRLGTCGRVFTGFFKVSRYRFMTAGKNPLLIWVLWIWQDNCLLKLNMTMKVALKRNQKKRERKWPCCQNVLNKRTLKVNRESKRGFITCSC